MSSKYVLNAWGQAEPQQQSKAWAKSECQNPHARVQFHTVFQRRHCVTGRSPHRHTGRCRAAALNGATNKTMSRSLCATCPPNIVVRGGGDRPQALQDQPTERWPIHQCKYPSTNEQCMTRLVCLSIGLKTSTGNLSLSVTPTTTRAHRKSGSDHPRRKLQS